ncbi:MAG: helix-turn-helix domain-containing protein [Elusimicrobiota bacterium]
MTANSLSVREYVKAKRRKAGLTQVQIAGKAGVGLRFVRDLEQGKRTLRMDVVDKILWLFGSRLGPVGLPRE